MMQTQLGVRVRVSRVLGLSRLFTDYCNRHYLLRAIIKAHGDSKNMDLKGGS